MDRHPRIDLSGKTFGAWHVNAYAGDGRWHCVCECGTRRPVLGASLREGRSSCCGCGILTGKRTGHGVLIDLTGRRFGALVVLRLFDRVPIGSRGNGKPRTQARWLWLCRCDCGDEVPVFGFALRRPDDAWQERGDSPTRRCKACSLRMAQESVTPPRGFVGVAKLAALAECSQRRIWRMLARGVLRPAGKTSGGAWYFQPRTALAALQAHADGYAANCGKRRRPRAA